MKKRSIQILVIATVLCIIGLVWLFLKKAWGQNPNELTLYGNIEIRQVDLGFRVGGRVKKMYFEEGDEVHKGDLLAELDAAPYKAARDKSIGQAAADKATFLEAQSRLDRNLPLCKDETVSRQECTTLTNTRNETKSKFEASIAALEESEVDLRDTRIYSPSRGIITTRIQEPGAIVTGSQGVYTLSKNKPVWVRAFVPEPDLANIKYGMKAHVYTDTINPKTKEKRGYTGWIGYISPVAEFTPKTVQTTELRTDLVYRIRVYIYEVDAFLRQGMPVTIKIDLGETEVREKVTDEDDSGK